MALYVSKRVEEYMSREEERGEDSSAGFFLWSTWAGPPPVWTPPPRVLKLQLCFYRCHFCDPKHWRPSDHHKNKAKTQTESTNSIETPERDRYNS